MGAGGRPFPLALSRPSELVGQIRRSPSVAMAAAPDWHAWLLAEPSAELTSGCTEAAEAHRGEQGAAGDIGLFGFARSKVHFYAASSLIYLPDGVGAQVAAQEALIAIELFQAGPSEERFITDESLLHIYGANAYIQQGPIDAATELLTRVFTTPEDQRVSWHRQRLSVLEATLKRPTLRILGKQPFSAVECRFLERVNRWQEFGSCVYLPTHTSSSAICSALLRTRVGGDRARQPPDPRRHLAPDRRVG